MARILVKEYCLELAGAFSCAGSVCVFVMPSALWSRRVQPISCRSRNRTRKYAVPMTRMSYFRMMSGANSRRTNHPRTTVINHRLPMRRIKPTPHPDMIMANMTVTVMTIGIPTKTTTGIQQRSEESSIDCSCRIPMTRTTPWPCWPCG
jgi:hypothetical protein